LATTLFIIKWLTRGLVTLERRGRKLTVSSTNIGDIELCSITNIETLEEFCVEPCDLRQISAGNRMN